MMITSRASHRFVAIVITFGVQFAFLKDWLTIMRIPELNDLISLYEEGKWKEERDLYQSCYRKSTITSSKLFPSLSGFDPGFAINPI